ncbi:oxygen-insensitive NADPH nitroreductase [Neptunomonas sp.]|uniref:oxygen-insensitive NADPH nitroreductase n=1 Tax=Neptunomonas sp. TaxID=1971898 RepID=UPI0025F95FBA|nr:oxygen-insensitive NADPH nitroreductase [Neptunomonas sp.]
MNPTIDLLNNHRSIRTFKEQAVSQEIINTLVTSGQAAATSSFIQACTVIQVENPQKREKLAEYAGNQKYVQSAPVFLVFCADMNRHEIACNMHNEQMKSGFTEQFITATVDCALFAQNVAIAAESLDLGVVYIGGIRNKISDVCDLLDLPKLVYPVFGMCIGYPDQEPEIKPRLPLPIVLKKDSYSNIQDSELLADYDKAIRDYYLSRSGGNKDMSWSEQIAGMLVKEARPHMLDFLQERGYLLK